MKWRLLHLLMIEYCIADGTTICDSIDQILYYVLYDSSLKHLFCGRWIEYCINGHSQRSGVCECALRSTYFVVDGSNTVFASPIYRYIGDQYLIYRRPIFCRLASVDNFVDDVIE